MGFAGLLLVAVIAGVALLATHRWADLQRKELEGLEPPPSYDSVGSWEAELLAAQLAAGAPQVPDDTPPSS